MHLQNSGRRSTISGGNIAGLVPAGRISVKLRTYFHLKIFNLVFQPGVASIEYPHFANADCYKQAELSPD